MIYTSYFSNYKQFPAGSVVVSIAQFAPKGWKGLELRSLAPPKEKLMMYKNHEIDEKVFEWWYLIQLNKDVNLRDRVIKLLQGLEEKYGNVVLCCYEKKGEFCHRQVLREWLDIGMKEL